MPETSSLELAGGCHCGAVRFRVRLVDPTTIICNCSICTMKGFAHLIVTRDALTIEKGLDQLSEYRFNTMTARHTFCSNCGVHPFYVPRSHPDGWSVNRHCLDDQTYAASIPVQPFDGRAWELHIESIR